MASNRNTDAVTSLSHRHNNIHVINAAIYTRKSSEDTLPLAGTREDLNKVELDRTRCAV
ncbi:MAG: hypothetical protein ACRCY4_05340 [Brevinema sp.]